MLVSLWSSNAWYAESILFFPTSIVSTLHSLLLLLHWWCISHFLRKCEAYFCSTSIIFDSFLFLSAFVEMLSLYSLPCSFCCHMPLCCQESTCIVGLLPNSAVGGVWQAWWACFLMKAPQTHSSTAVRVQSMGCCTRGWIGLLWVLNSLETVTELNNETCYIVYSAMCDESCGCEYYRRDSLLCDYDRLT